MRTLSLNIRAGGFSKYDPTLRRPEREGAILEVINEQREYGGLDSFAGTDVYRWDEVYGGNEGIARHLGFSAARFLHLDDPTLDKSGAGLGILYATDEEIAETEYVRADNRNALVVRHNIGRAGLQLVVAYLDHATEEARIAQYQELDAQLEDMPTVLVGDLNGLRNDMRGARLQHRMSDLAIRCVAPLIPNRLSVAARAKGVNQRKLIPEVLEKYVDADATLKRPTMPARFPVFGVDYMLHTPDVAVSNFNVVNTPSVRRATDHAGLVADIAPAA